MNPRTAKLFLFTLFVFATAVSGQQMKPTEIVYSRLPTNPSAPPTGANSPTIWIVGQDGSNDRFITNGTGPRISDDGRFLLFKRFPLTSYFNPFWIYPEFFVRELATGQETRIIPPSFDEPSAGHFFSPESNQGSYEIVYDCGERLCKLNRDGTNRFRFPWANAEYSYDNFPAVRRGDQLVALSNNRASPDVGGLYTVGISGTPRQKIPNTTCRDFHPAWSNDNQFIALGTIYWTPLGNCDNNSNFPPIDVYPYWISNLVKIRPDGTGRQQLTNFPTTPDCSQQSATCLTLGYVWTEDNSKIIAAGRINGTKGLFAFNTDGSGAFSQIPISTGNAPDYVGGIVQPRVEQNVVSIGGGVTASGNYSLVSTIGEAVAGITSATGQYTFESGFWAIPGPARRTAFDFDGDGRADFAIYRPSNGVWWYMRSSTNNVETPLFIFGTSTDIIAPADMSGDGKTDLVFFRPSTGQWFIQRSEDNTFSAYPFGANGDIPAPADYDGDGKADAAVFRPSNGTWFILQSSDNQVRIEAFGLNGDQPVIGDYDGDGRSDIGIWRPSQGIWFINRSTAGILVLQLGVSTDKALTADFTGDGKTDIAVWRPATGFWFILRSEDFGLYGFPFGSNGDQPTPADYDGDGKADPAVFRPSTGTWFAQQSASSGTTIIPWGTAGDRAIPNAFVR